MRWLWVAALSLCGCSLFIGGEADPDPDVVAACPDNWTRAQRLAIDARIDSVATSETFVDVPVALFLDAGARAELNVHDDLLDLRVMAVDGAPLDFEIEFAGDDSRPAVVWLRLPELTTNSRDGAILIAGGNATPGGSVQNPNGVWQNQYAGVWHLDEQDAAVDSTGNGHAGTIPSTSGFELAEGQLGDAISGDDEAGDEAKIDVNPADGFGIAGDLSVEAWVFLTRQLSVDTRTKALQADSADGTGYTLRLQKMDELVPKMKTAQVDSEGFLVQTGTDSLEPLVFDGWRYLAGTVEVEPNRVNLFVDGRFSGTDTVELDLTTTPVAGADEIELAEGLVGRLDEVRLSSSARSEPWFEIQYKSMTNDLLVPGAVQDCD